MINYTPKLSFNEVIFFLNHPTTLVNPTENPRIDAMLRFFKHNKFFSELEASSGVKVVKKCLSKLEYAKFDRNNFVMRQGDEGDSYFIILKGNVQILQNKIVEEDFECHQLMQRVVECYEDIVDDIKKQEALKELRFYFKPFIKVKEIEGKEVFYIDE